MACVCDDEDASTDTLHIEVAVSTRVIAAFSFCGLEKLFSVSLPHGLAKIDPCSFTWCVSLKTIKIPPTVKILGSYCFCQCSGIKLISLPVGVQVIENNAFAFCKAVRAVELPCTRSRASFNNGFSASDGPC